jgi:hypothetical protein
MGPTLYWCPGLQAKYFSSDGTGEIVGRWLMVVPEGPRITFSRAVFFSNN